MHLKLIGPYDVVPLVILMTYCLLIQCYLKFKISKLVVNVITKIISSTFRNLKTLLIFVRTLIAKILFDRNN